MHNGSYHCKGIKFSLTEIVGSLVFCHCKSCKKSSGSAFAANGSVAVDEFNISCGEEMIATYESSPGKIRHFCNNCGSPLFTKVGDNPTKLRIRLGSLDTAFEKTPSAHIFIEDAAGWELLTDILPKYDTWPPVDVLKIHGSRQEGKVGPMKPS